MHTETHHCAHITRNLWLLCGMKRSLHDGRTVVSSNIQGFWWMPLSWLSSITELTMSWNGLMIFVPSGFPFFLPWLQRWLYTLLLNRNHFHSLNHRSTQCAMAPSWSQRPRLCIISDSHWFFVGPAQLHSLPVSQEMTEIPRKDVDFPSPHKVESHVKRSHVNPWHSTTYYLLCI